MGSKRVPFQNIDHSLPGSRCARCPFPQFRNGKLRISHNQMILYMAGGLGALKLNGYNAICLSTRHEPHHL